jgi:ABC-type Fe3+ transport system permease subunit
MNSFKIASIAAALVVVAGLMMNWSDIKRYIKIERM